MSEPEPALTQQRAEEYKLRADHLGVQGRIDEAIPEYLNAIDEDANYLPAYVGLAQTLQLAGRLEEALAAYREGLEVDPNSIEIHAAMACVLAQMRRLDESSAAHARAASINPNSALTHHAHGEIMFQRGDLAAATDCYRQAVATDPAFPAAWNSLGSTLSSLGRFEEAAECFRRLLELCPESASAYSNLVNTGKHDAREVTARLKELLARPSLPTGERIHAEFALGKLLDKAERFDEAFSLYADANSLAKARLESLGYRYDPAGIAAQIEQNQKIFTRDFFNARRGFGVPTELPVFVVGMPRSGTTLVEQIAASHSRVHGAGELRDLVDIAINLGGQDHKSAAEGWTQASIRKAAECHLRRLQAFSPSATRVIDKMPGNVFRVGLIALMFPNARVIQCRRDPRDTCLSCYFQYFADSNLFSFDLTYCGHHYLATEKLLDQWRDVAPLPILDVQYEELVSNPESESRRIIEFLGLPWEPACLEFHRNSSTVTSSSVWQVRQPIYRGSVGRWKHYEKHLEPLMKVLGS
jgi:tetratricopeptide (TPR) repeat protein